MISSTCAMIMGDVTADLTRSQLLDADSINIFKWFHKSDRRSQDAMKAAAAQRKPAEQV